MSIFTIRTLRQDDAAPLLAFEQANRAWFERHIDGRPDDFYSLDGIAAHIAQFLAEHAQGRMHPCVIVGEHGELIGRANLKDIDQEMNYSSSVIRKANFLTDQRRHHPGEDIFPVRPMASTFQSRTANGSPIQMAGAISTSIIPLRPIWPRRRSKPSMNARGVTSPMRKTWSTSNSTSPYSIRYRSPAVDMTLLQPSASAARQAMQEQRPCSVLIGTTIC